MVTGVFLLPSKQYRGKKGLQKNVFPSPLTFRHLVGFFLSLETKMAVGGHGGQGQNKNHKTLLVS